MENIIHADIFFFVTTIAVVVFIASVITVTIFLVRILRDMKHISETMSKESDKLIVDIEVFRAAAMAEGAKVRTIANFFLDRLFRRKAKSNPIKK